MTVQLPEFVGGAIGDFRQIDSVTTVGQSKANASGVAVVTFSAVDGDRQWQVTRAAITCTGTIAPEPALRVYAVPSGQPVDDRYLRSGTDRGLYDEADYPDDGLIVREGEQLTFVWTGAPVAAAVTATVQYRLMGR